MHKRPYARGREGDDPLTCLFWASCSVAPNLQRPIFEDPAHVMPHRFFDASHSFFLDVIRAQADCGD